MRNYTFLTGLILILAVCTSVFGAAPPEQWAARYNGPDNDVDYALDLTIDNSGNIYVTGYSYDSNGYTDYATIKYDPNGNQLWAARYNGPGNSDDSAVALAVDSSGNVYVTGYSYGTDSINSDYATVKYDPNGNQLWIKRYNGPDNSDDSAVALAVDSWGNVYITGSSYISEIGNDYATVKYGPDGNQLWVSSYNGPANGDDSATALAIDSSGNTYVTGCSYGGETNGDYATVKYSSDGNQLWVARYNGPDNSDDYAYDLAVDSSGNVYATGGSVDSNGYPDFATIKYNSNGTQLWSARYNGPYNTYDEAIALAIDSSGNIYVAGHSYDIDTFEDYATIKYSPDGNELWVVRYNGAGNQSDIVNAMALDNSDNVYITGYSYSPETSADYATVKYDHNGNQLWVVLYNGPENGGEEASDLAIDRSNNVYVTGSGYNSETNMDYITVKYNQQGYCTGPVVGDLNNDCKVDFEDFAILGSHWLECTCETPEDCW